MSGSRVVSECFHSSANSAGAPGWRNTSCVCIAYTYVSVHQTNATMCNCVYMCILRQIGDYCWWW